MGTSEDFVEAARAAVAAAITEAKQNGGQINVGEVVTSIRTRFPTAELGHCHLETEAARIAIAEGVTVIEFRPEDSAPVDVG
jgi:hypothetical protein